VLDARLNPASENLSATGTICGAADQDVPVTARVRKAKPGSESAESPNLMAWFAG